MTKSNIEWFETWFDSPYYSILYKHRDKIEAQNFLDKLLNYCQLDKNSHILDLACGEGRHAIYLNQLGYRVTGIDLSANMIGVAKSFSNEKLHFVQADMRNPFPEKYDAILNLFTSFGYFLDEKDDLKIVQNIKDSLSKNGLVVIDFLNTLVATKNMVSNEVQEINDTKFVIDRYISDGCLIKEIKVDGKNYYERVKCLDLLKIKNLVNKVGLEIYETFGDYQLNPFDKNKSSRLIILLRAKPSDGNKP